VIKSGNLDKRVTIQSPVTGQNAYGEPLTGWTDVATVWASLTDLSGREFLAAQATQATVTTKVLIRYRAGIVAAMRVVHGADVYNVMAVLKQGDDGLLLMTERGANNG